MFLVFRFFAGAGAFMILAAVPIWMAEVVPPFLRGALVQLHAVILVIGYMCASVSALPKTGLAPWGMS